MKQVIIGVCLFLLGISGASSQTRDFEGELATVYSMYYSLKQCNKYGSSYVGSDEIERAKKIAKAVEDVLVDGGYISSRAKANEIWERTMSQGLQSADPSLGASGLLMMNWDLNPQEALKGCSDLWGMFIVFIPDSFGIVIKEPKLKKDF